MSYIPAKSAYEGMTPPNVKPIKMHEMQIKITARKRNSEVT